MVEQFLSLISQVRGPPRINLQWQVSRKVARSHHIVSRSMDHRIWSQPKALDVTCTVAIIETRIHLRTGKLTFPKWGLADPDCTGFGESTDWNLTPGQREKSSQMYLERWVRATMIDCCRRIFGTLKAARGICPTSSPNCKIRPLPLPTISPLPPAHFLILSYDTRKNPAIWYRQVIEKTVNRYKYKIYYPILLFHSTVQYTRNAKVH